MPLTPEDVSNKRFTPVRLREGYDMGEVDQFLDEVESELERLHAENDDLQSKLSAAQQSQGSKPAPAPEPEKAPEPVVEKTPEPQPEQAPAVASVPQAGTAGTAGTSASSSSAASSGPTELKVTTVADASSAAARLLEIATRNADELVDGAKDEADRIVGAARTKAERLESEVKTKADQMESDARTRAQMLDSETEARRKEIFGDMEREKSRLDGDIENLRSFEREYRSRLKSYFAQQLETLDGGGSGGGSLPSGSTSEHAPKRLKSILGEDEGQADNA